MIKGIGFDFEGTVVNVEEAHHKAHLEVCQKVGLDISFDEAIKKIPHFIGGPDSSIIAEIYELGDKSLSSKEMLKLDKQFYKKYLNSLDISPRPGFLDFLETIKKKNIDYAIGSLTATEDANLLFEKTSLYEYFPKSKIVLKEHVKNLKPFPDVFLETAKRMQILPENQLVFEDSPNGVLAGKKAGSFVVGMPVYKLPNVIMPLIQNGVCRLFYDWREINVVALINNLNKELLNLKK